MATEVDGRAWGGPARMKPSEAVMWRAEGDLRTRSSGCLVELLESAPDWARFRRAHERATLAIPRLRERVVEPLVPVVTPTWTPDAGFDLDYHLQRVRLPEPGGRTELLNLVSQVTSRPLDPNRAQWEAILVEGLDDAGTGAKAAYLLKVHHAMSDGLGMVQLLDMAHSRTEEPGGNRLPDASDELRRPAATPLGLVADRVLEDVTGSPGRVLGAARFALGLAGRLARDPVGELTSAVDFGRSLGRMLSPPEAERSPLLRDGGFGYRALVLDVELAGLRAAGKAVGCSVNDAFLAALLGGFRRYHEAFGVPVERMPMAIPISLRDSSDPMGGNRFTGARFVAPVGEPDPAERMRQVREFVLNHRKEPAVGFLELVSPVLNLLPSPVLTELVGSMTRVSDVQASNIPGLPHPVYLAGVRVLRTYAIGPRPGVAAMVAMISYDGTCCIGVNVDPESVSDIPLLERCLAEGFTEVVEVGES
jgi:diacylglycerol O-acyltransferase / wax synthase